MQAPIGPSGYGGMMNPQAIADAQSGYRFAPSPANRYNDTSPTLQQFAAGTWPTRGVDPPLFPNTPQSQPAYGSQWQGQNYTNPRPNVQITIDQPEPQGYPFQKQWHTPQDQFQLPQSDQARRDAIYASGSPQPQQPGPSIFDTPTQPSPFVAQQQSYMDYQNMPFEQPMDNSNGIFNMNVIPPQIQSYMNVGQPPPAFNASSFGPAQPMYNWGVQPPVPQVRLPGENDVIQGYDRRVSR
jgi:hypothetical protein